MALRLSHEEKTAVHEALTYHYLFDLDSYGVPEGELSESEAETRKALLSAETKLGKHLDDLDSGSGF